MDPIIIAKILIYLVYPLLAIAIVGVAGFCLGVRHTLNCGSTNDL